MYTKMKGPWCNGQVAMGQKCGGWGLKFGGERPVQVSLRKSHASRDLEKDAKQMLEWECCRPRTTAGTGALIWGVGVLEGPRSQSDEPQEGREAVRRNQQNR